MMRKTKRAALLLALGVSVLAPTRALGWDALGHKVVARIAWDGMTPQAREAAVALLRQAPPLSDLNAPGLSDREEFLYAATWPDVVKSNANAARREAYNHSNWHFINWFWESGPDGRTRERTDFAPADTNAVERLAAMSAVLRDASQPDSARAIALAWVLHLGGDIVQPLHTSAHITATEPEGDQGGNLYRLNGRNNLHSYWDGLLGSNNPWRPGDRSEEDYIEGIAERIESREPYARLRTSLQPGDFMAWARRSYMIAQKVPYTTPRGQEPSAAYRERAYRAVQPEVARAGYRLAEMLNAALGR
jgi:hypothetical protein